MLLFSVVSKKVLKPVQLLSLENAFINTVATKILSFLVLISDCVPNVPVHSCPLKVQLTKQSTL